jgi:hypothetical protein
MSSARAFTQEYGYMPNFMEILDRKRQMRPYRSRPDVPEYRPINYVDTMPKYNVKSGFILLYNAFINEHQHVGSMYHPYVNQLRLLTQDDTFWTIFSEFGKLKKAMQNRQPDYLNEAFKKYSHWHTQLPNVYKGKKSLRKRSLRKRSLRK